MHLSGGSGSAGGPSVHPVFFSLHLFLYLLDLSAEQLGHIRHSGRHVELQERWMNTLCERQGRPAPCTSSSATKLLVFQMALTDDTIRQLSLLTTCSAWNGKLQATPTCTKIFPFFCTLKYSVYESRGRDTMCIRNKLQLGRTARGCGILSHYQDSRYHFYPRRAACCSASSNRTTNN